MGVLSRARRSWWVVPLGVLLVAALVAGAWFVFHRSDGQVTAGSSAGPGGGGVWSPDGRVEVVIAPGGVAEPTAVTFAAFTRAVAEAPLSALSAVVGAPVEITPQHPVSDAEVAFVFDQHAVPTTAAQSGQPVPTIRNAGIEVFNDSLGTWVPIPSVADEATHQVRAHAPHFSGFRLAVSKIGTFVVNAGQRAITVVLDATTKLIDLVAKTTVGAIASIYRDLTGTFDETKFQCEPVNDAYQVEVRDGTRQHKIDACVTKANDGVDTLLIKNGLAVPFQYSASNTRGVRPGLEAESDVVALARNFVGVLLGRAVVSGLEATHFDIGKDAPATITVDGSVSWIAVALDVAIAVVTVILPVERTVTTESRTLLVTVRQRLSVEIEQSATTITYEHSISVLQSVIRETRISSTAAGNATMVLELLNCEIARADSVHTTSWAQATDTIVTTLRSCLSTAARAAGAAEFEAVAAAVGAMSSAAKVLPEVGQLTAMGMLALFGQDTTKVAFVIRRGEPWSSPSLTLTDSGLGAVRIGMTSAEAKRATKVSIAGPQDPACPMYGRGTDPSRPSVPSWRADANDRVELIVTGGPLFGISPNVDIHTDTGLRLGDSLDKALTIYGPRAKKRVDIYGTTVITIHSDHGTALRLDSSTGRTIDLMQVGTTKVIDYAELCG